MKHAGENIKGKQLARALILPVALWYMEILAGVFLFGAAFDKTFFLKTLFALGLGCLLALGCVFMTQKHAHVYTAVVLAALAVLCSFHIVYFSFFASLFSWHTIGLAGDITDFWREALMAILKNLYKIALMFLPFVLWLIGGKKLFTRRRMAEFPQLLVLVLSILLTAANFIAIVAVKDNRRAFTDAKTDITASYRYYGVTGGGIADLAGVLFKMPDEDVVNPYEDDSSAESSQPQEPEEILYDDNVLPIDFDALIASEKNQKVVGMHKYFASVPPTKQNEYTGYFKGKNLIFLTLEGYTYRALDPKITPTLYKMYNEGFVFRNFYDSAWGGSTATGEYSNMTGNFYTTANCLKQSASTNTYSALGNMFRASGYKTYAYHNHTYKYYSRHLSHPNFGYDVFTGIGNGMKLASKAWPNSDREMAVATTDEFLNAPGPFHVYYMTVSGHANYTWMGNAMSYRHKAYIKEQMPDTTLSENVQAYLSCQYEVELMMQELLQRLEAAGKLQDTVIAMCCDHYPYALSDAELAELYDLPVEGIRSNFDLYRNAFILWSASMEQPVVVDTPCSSYDMAPTLYNLFGLPYDSRLITGTDILSDTENVVIINTLSSGGSWNWITDKGRYSVKTGKFTPAEGVSMTEEECVAYGVAVNQKVAAMRKFSPAILDNDYYSHVFNKDMTLKATLAEARQTTTATETTATETTGG